MWLPSGFCRCDLKENLLKKLSGTPRVPIAEWYGLDPKMVLDFYHAVDVHLGAEPDGENPGLRIRPSLYWVKRILQNYINRRSKINGKPNVSVSPKETIDKLTTLSKKIDPLFDELSDIILNDRDTDEALHCAMFPYLGKSMSGLTILDISEIHAALRFLSLSTRDAIKNIEQFKTPDMKRFKQWPGYVAPNRHLIIDLAQLYHIKKGNVEQKQWQAADNDCVNKGADTKHYKGPFYDFVQDCFEAFNISEHSSNRALGEEIKESLKQWKDMYEQGFSLPW